MLLTTFTYTEPDLVTALQKNERHAFEYLYHHYSISLYRLCCRIMRDERKAEDVTQESFLKIWKNISQYSSDKGTLFTWMLNIARNTAIDSLRKDKRTTSNSCSSQFSGWEGTLSPMLVIYQPQSTTFDLRDLVEQLQPERKVLVDLVYFQGFTHEEVSEHLNVPLGTVKSRIRTALRDLRLYYLV
jgi:RNA polymerase sigma factor (sigma-70 family)